MAELESEDIEMLKGNILHVPATVGVKQEDCEQNSFNI